MNMSYGPSPIIGFVTLDGPLTIRKSYSNMAYFSYQKNYSKMLPEGRLLLFSYDAGFNYQFDILGLKKDTLINKGTISRNVPYEYGGITHIDVRNDTILALITAYTSDDKTIVLNKIDMKTLSLIEAKVVTTTVSKEKFDYNLIKPLDDSKSKYLPVSDEVFLTSKKDYDKIIDTKEVLSKDSSKYLFYRILLLDNDHIVLEGKMLDFVTNSVNSIYHDFGEEQSGVMYEKSFVDELILFNNGDWMIPCKLFEDYKMKSYVFNYYNGKEVKKITLPFNTIGESIDEKAPSEGMFIENNGKSCDFLGYVNHNDNAIFYRLKFDFDSYSAKLAGRYELTENAMDSLNMDWYGKTIISPQSKQAPNGDFILCLEDIHVNIRTSGSVTYQDGLKSRNIYAINLGKDFRQKWIYKDDKRSAWLSAVLVTPDCYSVLNFKGDSVLVITAVDSKPKEGMYYEYINLNSGIMYKRECLIEFTRSSLSPGALVQYDDTVLFQNQRRGAELEVYTVKK